MVLKFVDKKATGGIILAWLLRSDKNWLSAVITFWLQIHRKRINKKGMMHSVGSLWN